jgi:tartrate dehydrogenase/decarboxylase/D-malate dehydrogenase
MPYWDERFAAVAKEYPEVKTSQFHVDILAAHLVRNPHWFDVIVGSNLFGDILSDLGPRHHRHHRHCARRQHQPRARLPLHVRAGARQRARHRRQGHRQPIGQIWSGAMMLEHLGHKEAANAIVRAIEKLFADTDVRTGRHGRQGLVQGARRGPCRAGEPGLRAGWARGCRELLESRPNVGTMGESLGHRE